MASTVEPVAARCHLLARSRSPAAPSLEGALAFARLAKVEHLMPFHHDPAHDDNTLDAFFAENSGTHDETFTFSAAREGATFEVGQHAVARARPPPSLWSGHDRRSASPDSATEVRGAGDP